MFTRKEHNLFYDPYFRIVREEEQFIIMLKGDWLRSWGFDSGAELNVVCEGDGKLTITAVKYREEGTILNLYRFIKIRWEGYTKYDSTSSSRALIFEFFLFDTGNMELEVQTSRNNPRLVFGIKGLYASSYNDTNICKLKY